MCGEPGQRDPVLTNVLICRYSHKSLVGDPHAAAPSAPPAAAPAAVSLLPLDGGNITVSPADLDEMLADPEIREALNPEILAALAQVTHWSPIGGDDRWYCPARDGSRARVDHREAPP